MICMQKNGSMAKYTWETKVAPQLNHDLFSFTSTMKNGWQMNGKWKKTGIEIELNKFGDPIFIILVSGCPGQKNYWKSTFND